MALTVGPTEAPRARPNAPSNSSSGACSSGITSSPTSCSRSRVGAPRARSRRSARGLAAGPAPGECSTTRAPPGDQDSLMAKAHHCCIVYYHIAQDETLGERGLSPKIPRSRRSPNDSVVLKTSTPETSASAASTRSCRRACGSSTRWASPRCKRRPRATPTTIPARRRYQQSWVTGAAPVPALEALASRLGGRSIRSP